MRKRTEPCVVCGDGTAVERVRVEQKHFVVGRTAKFRHLEFRCEKCEESYESDEQTSRNSAAEQRAVQLALKDLGGAELRALREAVRATQEELETVLGVGKKTVIRWEKGTRAIPSYVQVLLRLLAINPRSIDLLKSDGVSRGQSDSAESGNEGEMIAIMDVVVPEVAATTAACARWGTDKPIVHKGSWKAAERVSA